MMNGNEMDIWFKMIKTFQYRDDNQDLEQTQIPGYTPMAVSGMPKTTPSLPVGNGMVRPPAVQPSSVRAPNVRRDLKPKPERGSIESDNGASSVGNDRLSSNGIDEQGYFEPDTPPPHSNHRPPSNNGAISPTPTPLYPNRTPHYPSDPSSRISSSAHSSSISSVSPSPGPFTASPSPFNSGGRVSPYPYPSPTPNFSPSPAFPDGRSPGPGRPPKPPKYVQPAPGSHRVPPHPPINTTHPNGSPPFASEADKPKLDYIVLDKMTKNTSSKKSDSSLPPRSCADDQTVEYADLNADATLAIAKTSEERRKERNRGAS